MVVEAHPLFTALPTVRAIAAEFDLRAVVRRALSQPYSIEICDRNGVIEIGYHDVEIVLDGDLPKHRNEWGEWDEFGNGDGLRELLHTRM